MSLKKIPADNKGLSKLPKKVRNKMGYMKTGGTIIKKVLKPKSKTKRITTRPVEQKGKLIQKKKTGGVVSSGQGKVMRDRIKTTKMRSS